MFGLLRKKTELPTAATALPGRATPIPTAERHFVNGHPLAGPYPEGMQTAMFGMGCFWGVERRFWKLPGVWVTAVGYAAGITPNATYQEVCSGQTYGPDQAKLAEESRDMFQARLTAAGHRAITTEILPAPEFYFAEDYHQQYLAKNPGGYCGGGGVGVTCPVGVGA
jgi:peptide-methionine (S)-S-oxide reductase